jgi:hypothetical protein
MAEAEINLRLRQVGIYYSIDLFYLCVTKQCFRMKQHSTSQRNADLPGTGSIVAHAIRHVCLLLFLLTGSLAYAQAPAWQSAMAVGGNYYPVTATATNANNEIYVAGQFLGSVSFGSTVLTGIGYSAFLAKWSTTTNSFVWAKQIEFGAAGPSIGVLTVNGSDVYLAGGFTISATFGSTTLVGTGINMYVAKLTDAGSSSSFVWAKQASGSGVVDVTGVAVTGTSVYVVGSFARTWSFGTNVLTSGNTNSLFIAKLTDAGASSSFTWATQGNDPYGSAASAVASSGTSVYVSGSFASTLNLGAATLTNTNGDEDLFVAKLTDVGTTSGFAWVQQSGGASGSAGATTLAVSGTNIYIAGSFNGVTTFGSTVLTAGGQFVAKLVEGGATGSFAWAKQFKTHRTVAPNTPYSLRLTLAVSGANLYVAGSYTSATFDNLALYSSGWDDIFVAKFTDAGTAANLGWVQHAGGSGSDYANAITLTSSGILYVGGTMASPAVFGSITLNTGQFGGYLASLQENTGLATQSPLGLEEIKVFPNPATSSTAVHVPARAGKVSLALFDMRGRLVAMQEGVSGVAYPLDLAGLAPGIYALRVQAGAAVATQKLVVE